MGDDTEPRFDLIDPRRSDRGEMEMHVRALLQPCLNIGRGVGGKIVQHNMNFLAGVSLDGFLEKEVVGHRGGLAGYLCADGGGF